jgi:hypothetical protein
MPRACVVQLFVEWSACAPIPILKKGKPGCIYTIDPLVEIFNVYVYCSLHAEGTNGFSIMRNYSVLELSDLKAVINSAVCFVHISAQATVQVQNELVRWITASRRPVLRRTRRKTISSGRELLSVCHPGWNSSAKIAQKCGSLGKECFRGLENICVSMQ